MLENTEVDGVIGARIKSRRVALKISQTSLATSVGVRFQQVQKYENGTNRVSASRLLAIADTLNVPVSYFFQGLGENAAEDGNTLSVNALTDSKLAEILALVETLPGDQQKAVLAFLRTLSESKAEKLDSDIGAVA